MSSLLLRLALRFACPLLIPGRGLPYRGRFLHHGLDMLRYDAFKISLLLEQRCILRDIQAGSRL